MTLMTALKVKALSLIVFFSLFYSQAEAQVSRRQIVNEKNAESRRMEKHVVVVETQMMYNLMAKCLELGIPDIKLVFARIRKDDIAQYLVNHPDAAGYESEILGKITVLIKVQADNLDENSFVSDPPQPASQVNSLIERMNNAGFVKVDKPYGKSPSAVKVIYFEVGSICPPPNSCR